MMVTTAFCKFIIGVFAMCLCGCLLCYVREWMMAQAEYAREQAQKRYEADRKKRDAEERAEIERLMAVFEG